MWVLQIRASDQRKRIESKRLKAREIEYSSFFVTSKMCLTSIISSSPSSSNSRLRSLSVESELSRRRRSIFVLIQILDWMFQVPSLRETSGRQQQSFFWVLGSRQQRRRRRRQGRGSFFPSLFPCDCVSEKKSLVRFLHDSPFPLAGLLLFFERQLYFYMGIAHGGNPKN